jgi:hypothetical protein
VRRIIATILALAALIGLSAVFSSAAIADGDPASDVLVYDSVFNPYDSGASPQAYAELQALVRYVSAHGYPLKVAMVASSADLGTVSQLWENPSSYSVYLGRELKLVFKGTLLVVMPQGYGLYVPVAVKNIPKGDDRAMADLQAPASDLVAGAFQVIQRLASDNGVTLPKTLSVTTAPARTSASSPAPLIGFGVGLLAVALAWGVSLRVRPLRREVAA